MDPRRRTVGEIPVTSNKTRENGLGVSSCYLLPVTCYSSLLKHPLVHVPLHVHELRGLKEQADLALRAFGLVRAVDQVATDFEAEVAANSTRRRVLRVRLAHRVAHGFDAVRALEDCGDDR